MDTSVKRIFTPGDQWLYFKIYTGYKTADHVLSHVLPTVSTRLLGEGVIDMWFFLRYSDPHSHLRLRFRTTSFQSVGFVIKLVNQLLNHYVSNDLVWKIQMDTYQRELERYGMRTIEHAETVFYYDSEAIIEILNLLNGNENKQQRWLLALKMIDLFLNDFGFNSDEKIDIIARQGEYFKKEFGFTTKEYKLQLDQKFRNNRQLIEECLTTNAEWMLPFLKIISNKSCKTKPVIDELLNLNAKKELEVPLYNLIGSYSHMMINRLFRSKQRLYEMTLYDMLERYYISVRARNKNIYGNVKHLKVQANQQNALII